jgi:LAO/AO transport system kinase
MEFSLEAFNRGDYRQLSKAITLVENGGEESEHLLKQLKPDYNIPLIGITGPPGAGKSTLINSLLKNFNEKGFRTAVVAVDPTSPFHHGSLLGDRLRMSEHFLSSKVFIRSLATRGSLGGLSAKTLEITDLLRSFPFDRIVVETVGVGQSEVEIAGLADTTVLVLVPESGDEVQGLKAGIMEIGDVFVVNKSDRDGADTFAKNLSMVIHERDVSGWTPPVIQCVASEGKGTAELVGACDSHFAARSPARKQYLFAERAWQLIARRKMASVNRQLLEEKIAAGMNASGFNLYRIIEGF